MPSRTFRQLIARARSDEEFAARLWTDPERLIAEYDLAEDEREALQSGEPAALGALGVEWIARARSTPDIYLIGSGVRKADQFTLEAIAALRRCRAVYSTLTDSIEWFLRDLVPRVESVWPLYRTGRDRSEFYAQIAGMVLEAAARERPVGFVTDGNPIVFNDISRQILEGAGGRGLDVRILPGVSSIDTVLADLKHDIAAEGLQVFGASRFVRRRIEPQIDVPCLLLVIGVFGIADVPSMKESRPGVLAPLQDHLARFYPPEHELVFVESADWWYQDAQIVCVRLDGLSGVDMKDVQFSSLFIPSLRTSEDGAASSGAGRRG